MTFKFTSIVIDILNQVIFTKVSITADVLSKYGSLVLFLLYVSMSLRRLVSMGITDSYVAGNSSILNQLEVRSVIARHIKSIYAPSFTFENVGSNEVHPQFLSRICYDKLCMKFTILMLAPCVDLTITTVFDM